MTSRSKRSIDSRSASLRPRVATVATLSITLGSSRAYGPRVRAGQARRNKANRRLTGRRYKGAMVAGSRRSEFIWWSAVAAAMVIGLALRVAAAQGGLWTDEAWSMIYAAEARDPAGVFLRINHDNNHHLNSLWLQAIGMQAPPWLARLPAIICSTASIAVAALFIR